MLAATTAKMYLYIWSLLNETYFSRTLNEINFDLVEHYIENGTKLPGFKSLINSGIIETYSESKI